MDYVSKRRVSGVSGKLLVAEYPDERYERGYGQDIFSSERASALFRNPYFRVGSRPDYFGSRVVHQEPVNARDNEESLMRCSRQPLLPTWLRFRIDVGACAYVKRRIGDLAETKGAALEHAHAATGAAAGKHIPANNLLSLLAPV